MGLILIFVDGVGIGRDDKLINPCLNSRHQIFSHISTLPFNGQRYALDAKLNVSGLPQSATSQTTIYTGINAARKLGKHLFGFPNPVLKELLKNESLFVKLVTEKYTCKFINAFRPIFFTSPELFHKAQLSTSTEMNRAANLPFSSIKDIKQRRAIYHDFTNQELINKGFKITEYDNKIAAEIIISQSKIFDLVLFEYFLTDKAGHSKNMKFALNEINRIENLIYEIVRHANSLDFSVIVCSDHGNIEDISTKSHTQNPALCAIWTQKKYKKLTCLMDIFKVVCQLI